MTITVISVLEKLEECLSIVEELREKLRKSRKPKGFLEKIDLLVSKFENFEDILPKTKKGIDRRQAFHRHISFVKGYFGKDQNLVVGNLDDVLRFDIPTLKEEMKRSFYNILHPHLREACDKLILSGEYDSVIRKSFLVVRELAKVRFSKVKAKNLDGKDLMTFLFHPESGQIKVHDERRKQEGFMNWAISLYVFFRNDDMHNLKERAACENECIIMSINLLLFAIDGANYPNSKGELGTQS